MSAERELNLLRDILETTGDHNNQVAAPQFARPADILAYAVGDLVANSTVAGTVVPLAFAVSRVPRSSGRRDPAVGQQTMVSGRVTRARIRKSTNVLTAASFRLHLYAASPVPANGDNGVWSTNKAAEYLGHIDVTVDKAFTDGAAGHGAPAVGQSMAYRVAAGASIFGLLEARGAYGPGNAEAFDVTLDVCQD